MKTIKKIIPLPPLRDDIHKGTAGRVLCIGGSKGLSGSILMSAKACLRSGAGLVTIACPQEIGDIIETASLETMTLYCPSTKGILNANAWPTISPLAQKSNVLLIGPGIGRTKGIPSLLKKIIHLNKDLVIDADALHCFQNLKYKSTADIILTPHIGEMEYLLQQKMPDSFQERANIAIQYAQEKKVILVLKSHRTIVTDGTIFYEEKAGNPGLAKGGSGDVLAGTIAAFLLLKDQPTLMNVIRAVHLHSLTADYLAQQNAMRSIIATDLIQAYSKTLLHIEKK